MKSILRKPAKPVVQTRPRVPIDVGAGQPVQNPRMPITAPKNFINPMTPKPGEPMVPGLGGGMVPASVAPYSFGKPPMMKKGGKVPSASKRADGIAVKGKTRGKIV